MRIIYLHQYFNTLSMPGATRSYEMARRLVESGHDVHIVTSWRGQTDRRGWFVTEEAGIKVHWLPVEYANSMGTYKRIAAFLVFAWNAARRAARLPCDVVFATSTPLSIVLPATYASWRLRVPMVFEVRDMWPDVPIAMGIIRSPLTIFVSRVLERFAYARAAHIVALAPGMKEDIARRIGSADKISVIPNGCDLELFRDGGKSGDLDACEPFINGRKVLLYAGAIGRANGCCYLVDLAIELDRRDVDICIVLIGDGAEKEALVRRASEAKLFDQNLIMLDRMPKIRVVEWMQRADMHIALMRGPQSYLKDAVNNKFFDAVAAGKPIANNFDGFQSRLAVDAGIGLILPSDDIVSAADQLIEALGNDEWLASVPANARRLAEDQFSRSKLARDLEELLLGVAGYSASSSG